MPLKWRAGSSPAEAIVNIRKKRKEEKRQKRLAKLPRGICYNCGEEFILENGYVGPCPFVKEVYDEITKDVILCLKCYHRTLDDI